MANMTEMRLASGNHSYKSLVRKICILLGAAPLMWWIFLQNLFFWCQNRAPTFGSYSGCLIHRSKEVIVEPLDVILVFAYVLPIFLLSISRVRFFWSILFILAYNVLATVWILSLIGAAAGYG
jgi:hypothetical protein